MVFGYTRLTPQLGYIPCILFHIHRQRKARPRTGYASLEWTYEPPGFMVRTSHVRLYIHGHHRHRDCHRILYCSPQISRCGIVGECMIIIEIPGELTIARFQWLIICLYGWAGTLVAYVAATIIKSPLAAFALAVFLQAIVFIVCLSCFPVIHDSDTGDSVIPCRLYPDAVLCPGPRCASRHEYDSLHTGSRRPN